MVMPAPDRTPPPRHLPAPKSCNRPLHPAKYKNTKENLKRIHFKKRKGKQSQSVVMIRSRRNGPYIFCEEISLRSVSPRFYARQAIFSLGPGLSLSLSLFTIPNPLCSTPLFGVSVRLLNTHGLCVQLAACSTRTPPIYIYINTYIYNMRTDPHDTLNVP